MGMNGVQGTSGEDWYVKRKEAVEEAQEEAKKEEVTSISTDTYSETNEDELVELECEEESEAVGEEAKEEPVSSNEAEEGLSTENNAMPLSSAGASEEILTENNVVEAESVKIKAEKEEKAEKAAKEESKTDETSKAEDDNELDLLEFKSLISSNSKLKELANKVGYGTLFDKLDTNHDGVISGSELKSISNGGSGIGSINLSDLESFLTESVQDLITKTDNSKKETTSAKENTKETKDTKTTNTSVPEVSATSSGTASSPSSSYNTGYMSNVGSVSGSDSLSEQISAQKALKEQKTKELDTKNAELNAVNDGTDPDVKAKQDVLDKAKGEYDTACDESKNPFVKIIKSFQDQNEEALEEDKENIENANTEIEEANSEISTQESNVNSYASKISSLESSIASLNSSKSKEGVDTSSINAKISSLQSQKSEAQRNKEKAQAALDAAKEKLEEAQNNLSDAEKSKEQHEETIEYLINLMKKVASEEIKEKLDAYIQAQNDLETTKTNKTNQLNSEIQTLQNEISSIESKIKNLETQQAQQVRQSQQAGSIQQNAALFTGTLDDMNMDAGQKLLQAALSLYGNNRTSHGRCGTGVSNAFYKAFGISLHGNGNQWGNLLAQRSDWVEITDQIKSVDELASLPAGAVVSWSKTGPSYESQTYGHVYISDGKGGEISDYYGNAAYANKRRANYGTFRVFVPKSTVA